MNGRWDPFKGKVENGILYARGACDEKGSTPGMVYGLALARELGLLEGFTALLLSAIWKNGTTDRRRMPLCRPRGHQAGLRCHW